MLLLDKRIEEDDLGNAYLTTRLSSNEEFKAIVI
jgi:hypothetical protein